MSVPDFTSEELAAVRAQVDRRWGSGEVDLAVACVELSLHGPEAPPSECPVVQWRAGGCSFEIHKIGTGRYQCHFSYGDLEHYGTGIDEYTDAGECALDLLETQADHQSIRSGGSGPVPG